MTEIANPASPLVPTLRGVHLFGFDGAPCSQRVAFALAEKGFARARCVRWNSQREADLVAPAGNYFFRPVSLIKKVHLTPEYAAIQPNMVVPALVHDGRLQVESMDIVRYVDGIGRGESLYPNDAALCEQLVSEGKDLHVSVRYVSFHWGLGSLGKVGDKGERAIRELERADSPEKLLDFYSRYNSDGIEEDTFIEHLRALEQGWGEQEARLAADNRPFLCGDTFSVADIIWSIKVLRILECGYPFAQNFPQLYAWFRRIEQRPGFQQGVMRSHRAMSLAFRAKAAVERWLGGGIARVSRAA